MRHRLLTLIFATAFLAAACGPGGTGSAAPTGGGGASGPAGTEAAFDPNSISGEVTLGSWASSPAEDVALKAALDGFAAKYPNIKLKQETVKGDYRVQMVTNFSSPGNVPDVFWVNAEYAPEWMAEGFLEPLDRYIAKQSFDMSPFYPAYESIFKAQDGTTYGIAKDGNTIAMAYNTDLVSTPPTTLAELVSTAESLKGNSAIKAPMCLNPALDRGLAFIYAQGGSLLTADNSASAIDTPESTAAVQWYLDLFKNGLGQSKDQLGDGWCGEALGKGHVAITFEGGWLKGAMDKDFPTIKWAYAEMPAGTAAKSTITYTGAYAMSPDSENKDAAWVVIQYLAGIEGMQKWTEGGIAIPSRSDVPVPAGFEVIVKGAEYAKPGAGFMPSYGGADSVQAIFGDAMNAQITTKTFDAGPVVAATKAKIDSVLK